MTFSQTYSAFFCGLSAPTILIPQPQPPHEDVGSNFFFFFWNLFVSVQVTYLKAIKHFSAPLTLGRSSYSPSYHLCTYLCTYLFSISQQRVHSLMALCQAGNILQTVLLRRPLCIERRGLASCQTGLVGCWDDPWIMRDNLEIDVKQTSSACWWTKHIASPLLQYQQDSLHCYKMGSLGTYLAAMEDNQSYVTHNTPALQSSILFPLHLPPFSEPPRPHRQLGWMQEASSDLYTEIVRDEVWEFLLPQEVMTLPHLPHPHTHSPIPSYPSRHTV